MLELLLCVLATWRISSMLVHEDGPMDVFVKLRAKAGIKYNEYSVAYGTNLISSLLSCLWCTSVWVGFVIAIFTNPAYIHIIIAKSFAFSAGAILFDEVLKRVQDGG